MGKQRELVMYLNGSIVPHSEAVALMRGRDFQAAQGFYDSERTFNGRVFKLRQHLERLYRGLTWARIDPGMTLEQMEAVTLGILEANRHLLLPGDEFVISQVVSLRPVDSPGGKPGVNVVIYCQPLDFAAFAQSYIRGVRIVTPTTYGVPVQEVPANAKQGGQQVFPLMLDQEGNITECTGANFMFVQDGRIKLPNRRNVLPGISMQTVLELAEALKVPVDEGEYSPYDVYVCEEAFISSTRYCMLPVATLNGLRIGGELPGPTTARLVAAWSGLVGVDFVRQALAHLPG